MRYPDGIVMLGRTTAAVLAAATLVVLTGCRTPPQAPLLGDRGVVPAAYDSPGAAGAPAEPLPQMPDDDRLESLLPPEPVTEQPFSTDELESLTEDSSGFEMPPVVESESHTYTVEKGDSLWEIAQSYGITHQELAAYNSIDVDQTLKVGTVLRIPPSASYVPPEERRGSAAGTVPTAPVPQGGRTYTVQKGDSLWKIADRFNVKLNDLKAVNNLDTPDTIVPGQKIVLPAGASGTREQTSSRVSRKPPAEPEEDDESELAPERPPVEAGDTTPPEPLVGTGEEVRPEPVRPASDRVALPNLLDHTVMEDDTLEEIAKMYGTTVDEIKEANPTVDSNEDLIPNMKILVPIE